MEVFRRKAGCFAGAHLALLPEGDLEAVLCAQIPCSHISVLAACDQSIAALNERLHDSQTRVETRTSYTLRTRGTLPSLSYVIRPASRRTRMGAGQMPYSMHWQRVCTGHINAQHWLCGFFRQRLLARLTTSVTSAVWARSLNRPVSAMTSHRIASVSWDPDANWLPFLL